MVDENCARCRALCGLVASYETELRWYRDNQMKYQEAIQTLDSEREANAVLTAELERITGARR